MKVAVVNYGMGNLGSVRRALEELRADVVLAQDPSQLVTCDRIILPGVGAFGEGMSRLRAGGWPEALRKIVLNGGTALLGICLGMQMLGDSSDEGGVHDGLGLVPGRVRRLDRLGCALRIPHVGWNEVTQLRPSPLLAGIPQATDFYFVHSYAFQAERVEDVVATASYGTDVVAVVAHGCCFGTQFHPEKSSKAGRQLLKNFLDPIPC
jgi:imidazole glycerol-phosphate synthase subunit HisH